jgi:8-oxo-dGTP pyrophosphatase MutT (NUDIX family)
MAQPEFHDDDIHVQVLKPPYFEPTGMVIPRREAWEKGLWFPTVNLWVVQREPVPSIIYQQRSPNIGWAPGKLDVFIGGHCENLETPPETLVREAMEEMGAEYAAQSLVPLGRKLAVGIGQDGTVRNSVVNIFMVEDNLPITRFLQQKKEVHAICACPIVELLKVHTTPGYSYTQSAIDHSGQTITLEVNADMFPPNWDPYHQKMARLADNFLKGETGLMY